MHAQSRAMAPIKRKNDDIGVTAHADKKPKRSSTSALSVSKEEEPFPRGGASVLTPLEHKQIQIQAKQDVLFEQSTGKKAAKNDFEDEENEDFEGDGPQRPTETISKGRKSNSRTKKKTQTAEEKGVHIEGLSYKVCTKFVKSNKTDALLSDLCLAL